MPGEHVGEFAYQLNLLAERAFGDKALWPQQHRNIEYCNMITSDKQMNPKKGILKQTFPEAAQDGLTRDKNRASPTAAQDGLIRKEEQQKPAITQSNSNRDTENAIKPIEEITVENTLVTITMTEEESKYITQMPNE